jgi:hypothetical protein
MERGSSFRRRITPVLVLVVLPLTALVCGQSPPAAQGTVQPSGSDGGAPTPAPIPERWKVTQDATGACQVATPPEWQLGTDFFLAMEEADPGPFAEAPGSYPPSGLALWGIGEGTPVPEGTRYQIRTSRVNDGQVCSVWRVKADIDFTDDEKSQLEQVGATMQEVP